MTSLCHSDQDGIRHDGHAPNYRLERTAMNKVPRIWPRARPLNLIR